MGIYFVQGLGNDCQDGESNMLDEDAMDKAAIAGKFLMLCLRKTHMEATGTLSCSLLIC